MNEKEEPSLEALWSVLSALTRTGRSKRRKAPKPASTREEIVQILVERPGSTLSDLVRIVGRGWGTLQYHVNRLVRAHVVRGFRAGRERRYFPESYDALRMKQISAIRRGRVAELALLILQEPGLAQHMITERTMLTRKILRRYVNLLLDAGLVVERREPARHHYFPTPELRELLGELTGNGQKRPEKP